MHFSLLAIQDKWILEDINKNLEFLYLQQHENYLIKELKAFKCNPDEIFTIKKLV